MLYLLDANTLIGANRDYYPIGRDPFLIASALADLDNRCIVTAEVSKPKKQRQNRRISDVCDQLGIPRRNAFEFFRELDFRTDWKTR